MQYFVHTRLIVTAAVAAMGVMTSTAVADDPAGSRCGTIADTSSSDPAYPMLLVRVSGGGTVCSSAFRAGFQATTALRSASQKPLVNTRRPSVAGIRRVGSTLTASPGGWNAKGVRVRYQWLRNGYSIPGATRRRYVLVRADIGKQVRVRVSVSKQGYGPGTAVSPAARKVQAAPPRNVSRRCAEIPHSEGPSVVVAVNMSCRVARTVVAGTMNPSHTAPAGWAYINPAGCEGKIVRQADFQAALTSPSRRPPLGRPYVSVIIYAWCRS